VKDAVDKGVMCTLNNPEEVELAKMLVDLHPWAKRQNGMVKYARGGGEANTVAVRLARAHTGKDKIAFCGYHGWSDFYLAANIAEAGQQIDGIKGHQITGLDPSGVPQGLGGTMLPWRYNQIDELKAILNANKGEVAAILMEPCRAERPDEGFLEEVRALATEHKAMLIFDEVSAGFRETLGGRHLMYGIEPDMATFAKAMSNGYAMAAILGTGAVMSAAHNTFISSSYWTERIGPAAAIATIKKIQKVDALSHVKQMGQKVQEGWKKAAAACGLKINVGGITPWPAFSFNYDHELGTNANRALSTLFKQEMLSRGMLANVQFQLHYAHKDCHINKYLAVITEVFALLAEWATCAAKDGPFSGAGKDDINPALKRYMKGKELEYAGFQRLCK